jgi:hypothetical protein
MRQAHEHVSSHLCLCHSHGAFSHNQCVSANGRPRTPCIGATALQTLPPCTRSAKGETPVRSCCCCCSCNATLCRTHRTTYSNARKAGSYKIITAIPWPWTTQTICVAEQDNATSRPCVNAREHHSMRSETQANVTARHGEPHAVQLNTSLRPAAASSLLPKRHLDH